MTTKENLMGLGVPHLVADAIGVTPVTGVTAVGATLASATRIKGTQYLTFVVTGTSGVRLPDVGASAGTSSDYFRTMMGGPGFIIVNATAAAIKVYASNNDLGSAVTIYQKGTSIAGTSGASIETGGAIILYPVTVSTWVGLAGASV